MYTHLKRLERKKANETYDIVKLICTFINYQMAKEYFTPPETVENEGFMDDIKNIDPNFDEEKYKEYLEVEA